MNTPSLVFGLALFFGILAQLAARRWSLPSIVLLLALGVLLGPDGVGWIQPRVLGDGLFTVVGFSVAVILFEGSMALSFRRLREEATVIQALVTVGALITAAAVAVLCHVLLGWEWRLSILCGTLVMVTGPTVINPLLRRIRPTPHVQNILEAEGIFVDAVGTLCAVVAFAALEAPERVLEAGAWTLAGRLGTGLVVGAVFGTLIAGGLRRPNLVPESLSSAFALSLVLATWAVSNAVSPESGALAVITAGVRVGNARLPQHHTVLHFKEQLTVMLLGLLFVILAADVRLAEVVQLGIPALFVVAAMMLVVRPAVVWLCTSGARLSWQERVFIGWMGPRGIVAAAVSSLFAAQLAQRGVSQAPQLRAFVFLVIAATVVLQGLSGPLLATALGVRRGEARVAIILGANGLALIIARVLRALHVPVTFIEAHPENARRAQEEGFRVVFGDALDERTLRRADPSGAQRIFALTHNESLNLLFSERIASLVPTAERYLALHRENRAVDIAAATDSGAHVLFGREQALDAWISKSDKRQVTVRTFTCVRAEVDRLPPRELSEAVLPLIRLRPNEESPIDEQEGVLEGDSVVFLFAEDRLEDGVGWLESHGWAQRSMGAEQSISA